MAEEEARARAEAAAASFSEADFPAPAPAPSYPYSYSAPAARPKTLISAPASPPRPVVGRREAAANARKQALAEPDPSISAGFVFTSPAFPADGAGVDEAYKAAITAAARAEISRLAKCVKSGLLSPREVQEARVQLQRLWRQMHGDDVDDDPAPRGSGSGAQGAGESGGSGGSDGMGRAGGALYSDEASDVAGGQPPCGIAAHAESCGRRSAKRFTSSDLKGANGLHKDVEAALLRGCFVYTTTKTHHKLQRWIYLPHSAACPACAAGRTPCSSHCSQQTVVFSCSPSVRIDSVQRSQIRKKEGLMLECRARCAACGCAPQHTDPDARHFVTL